MGSLKTLRIGLNRHFKSTGGIDIIKEVEFNKANKVFRAQCVQHKPQILNDDLKKLYESGVFNSYHPETLLNKVFFEIVLCFANTGVKMYDN